MGELKARMSRREFQQWQAFYRRWPFDDFHRFHRPAALVSSSMGGDTQAALDWLQPAIDGTEGLSDADVATLRAFGFRGLN